MSKSDLNKERQSCGRCSQVFDRDNLLVSQRDHITEICSGCLMRENREMRDGTSPDTNYWRKDFRMIRENGK